MKKDALPNLGRMVGSKMAGGFQRFARKIVRASGHPMAFGLAMGLIAIWAVTGPLFKSGDTWLLVINTVANLLTFLMIFLIRNAQNRESEAVQLKLDELIRATKSAHNTLLDIEELSEEELDRIKARFERLARKAREEVTANQTGTNPGEAPAVTTVVPTMPAADPPGGPVQPPEEFGRNKMA